MDNSLTTAEAARRYGIERTRWRRHVQQHPDARPQHPIGQRWYYTRPEAAEVAADISETDCPCTHLVPARVAKLLKVPRHQVVRAAAELNVGLRPNKRRLYLSRADIDAIKSHLEAE